MRDDRCGVRSQILRPWHEAEASLVRFLDTMCASDDAHTTALSLRARPIDEPNRFVDWLDGQSAEDETA